MAAPDDVIHQATRLHIMASLNALPTGETIEFGRLKAILGASDGNLGSHLATLERAGFVRILKDFVGKKPRTRLAMTKAGAKAYAAHAAYLRALLDGDV